MNTATKRLALRTAAILCLSWQACAPAAAAPNAAEYYEDALVRYEKKDFKGSIIQLKNALKVDSKQLAVQVLLGKALLANGEVNAAEAAFDEALRLGVNRAEIIVPLAEALAAQSRLQDLLQNPRYADAGLPADVRARLLLIKGAAASDVGSTADALRLLGEARKLASASADSWIAEVPIRLRAGQINEARAAASQAVALAPKSAQAAYQQAMVAHVGGDLKAALAEYRRCLELKPDHVNALVARAGIYIDQRKPVEAAADVKAARQADPKDPRAAFLDALLAERAGNAAAVRTALTEVTNLLDPFPLDSLRYRTQVLMLGGLAHFGLGQYGKAKPYLELVTRVDAKSPVSKLLAQVLMRERAYDRAIEALDGYRRYHANDAQATMLLASAHLEQGRHARAAQLTQEALKMTDGPALRAVHGMSLIGSGKFADGAAELEASLKKDPGQIRAGVSLAGIYLASGQTQKALAVAERLAKAQPANAGVANLLGSARAAHGDRNGARLAYSQALKLSPDFLDPQINLARLDIEQQAYDSALKQLNAVLAKDEKNVDAAMEVARIFARRGNAAETLRWLKRADDFSGPRLQPGLEMVDYHLAQGRPDLAREPLKRLQGKSPEAMAVRLALARVQLGNGEVAEAKSTLSRAATEASYDAATLVQIAELQLQADHLAGAAHALDKALNEKPNHLQARALRSSVHLLQGDLAKAEQLARSVVASDPKLGLGHGLIGDIARQRGQGAAAVEAYRKAHQIDNRAESLLRLFSALESTQRDAAFTLAEQWLRGHPDDGRVWRELAGAQARAGNMGAARKAYETAVRLGPRDVDAINNLANVLVLLRDPGALKVAEQALALQPDRAHVIGTVGWAAFHANQPARALQLLRDARLRDPSNASTRYFLAAVLAQQGRKDEARSEVEGALSGGGNFAYAKEARSLLETLR